MKYLKKLKKIVVLNQSTLIEVESENQNLWMDALIQNSMKNKKNLYPKILI